MKRGTIRQVGLLLSVFGVLVVGTTSCSKVTEKVSEKAAEKAIEGSTDGDADVDLSDDEVKIKTGDGSAVYGSKMPDGWPKDIPLPDNFEVTGGANIDQGGQVMITVVGTTKMSSEDVTAFYKDKMSGWEKESDAVYGNGDDAVASLSLTNGDRRLIVSANTNDAGSEVSFSYMVGTTD